MWVQVPLVPPYPRMRRTVIDWEHFDFDIIYKDVLDRRQEVRKAQMEDYQVPLNVIRPSSLGLCLRRQVFQDMGMGGDPDFDLSKIFDYGHLLQDEFVDKILEEYLGKTVWGKNVSVIHEYPIKSEFIVDGEKVVIKGFIDDLIVEHKNKNPFIPIEVKTIGQKFYKLKEPKAEHTIQVMEYLHDLKAPFGYVLYIHKGTLDSKTFKVDYDKAAYKKIRARAIKLYKYKRDGIIPPAEALIHEDDYWFKGVCDYCPYLAFCLEIGKEEVKSDD